MARRRYQWAWRSAVVRREMRREETQVAVADAIGLELPNPDNPAAGGIELKFKHFNASGLTDRSGGGSFASHDAATDTGRKPALTQTIYEGQGNPGKTLDAQSRSGGTSAELQHSTPNIEVAGVPVLGCRFEDEREITNYEQ
ncbi:MAG TPA: hypothetical protein VG347_04620 [Verrucomicrobiae bacterium]|nr:hypothetical protein [Verrucomicrobiae bacterium]